MVFVGVCCPVLPLDGAPPCRGERAQPRVSGLLGRTSKGLGRVFPTIWVSPVSGVPGTGASQWGDVGAFRGVLQCG